MEAKTITLQIGNSDNKLTQLEWSDFVSKIKSCIEAFSEEIFFSGFSPCDAPWQNACFVFNSDETDKNLLKTRIEHIRSHFRQDSVAWMEGETEFI